MSLSTYIKYDPAIAPQSGAKIAHLAPLNVNHRPFQPNGSKDDTTQKEWKINIPPGTNLGRRLSVRVTDLLINFTVAADAANDTNLNVLNANTDAPQSWLFNRITNTSTFDVDGQSFTYKNRENLGLFLRMTDEQKYSYINSGTPQYLDNCQAYDQSNPEDALHQSSTVLKPTRGSFPFQIMSNPKLSTSVAVTAQIKIPLLVEPLLNPIFWAGQNKVEAFKHLRNNAILTCTFINNPQNYIWSHVLPAGMAGAFSVSSMTWSNVELLASFYTPPPAAVSVEPAFYPCNKIRTETGIVGDGTLAAGASKQHVSNTYSLPAVPELIFINAREDDSVYNGTQVQDRYAFIDKISVNISNDSGKLSECKASQLFEISVRNGLDMKWSDWLPYSGNNLNSDGASVGTKFGPGSVLVLKPRDLSMGNLISNTTGSFDITFDVTLSNPVGGTAFTNLRFYSQFVFGGVMRINTDGECDVSTSLFSQSESVDIQQGITSYPAIDDNVADKYVGGTNMFGSVGSFMKKLKPMGNMLKKAGELGTVAGLVAPELLPLAAGATAVGDLMGGQSKMSVSQLKKKYRK